MNDKTKLSEDMATIQLIMAMGWTPAEDHGDHPEWRSMWFTPEGSGPRPRPKLFTDANDCEAVIRWLGEQGIGVDIYRRPWMEQESVTIYIQGEPIEWKEQRWVGDDWKQGVCELALKVLDTDREELLLREASPHKRPITHQLSNLQS